MLPRAIDDAQKAFTEVLNRFSKENTEPTKAKTMSRCKTADHGVILPCAAANHIEELLSTTFPLYACESRIKLNPVK